MKAYLLAAGYATRLHPLTLNQPKPLLEVAGRPILTHILARVEELPALSEVIVVGNHKFASALEAWARSTPCRVPLRVLDDLTTSDHDKRGAIGDIAFALEQVPTGDEDFLVVAGDNLLDFELRPLDRAFLVERKPLLVVRRVANPGGPSPYNEVSLDASGRVLGFREKPEHPVGDLAAIALYFWPPEVAARIAEYLATGGNPDAPGFFMSWLVERAEVVARPMPGRWWDIGSLESLERARREFSRP
jgi:glucose-1-phosphate thymidylyltransferase